MEIVRFISCSFLLISSLFFTILSSGVYGVDEDLIHHHECQAKLFAFGDSHVDTGNFPKNDGAWLEPYGLTFPGEPSGRFSDGRVITDYIASFLGIETPMAYRWRKIASQTQLKRGMNFACGGSGVYETFNNFPNLQTQINRLNQFLLHQHLSKQELADSVAFVSISGNDYGNYMRRNGTLQDMPNFTRKLIKQLGENLQQIEETGIHKIAVAGFGPSGCFPTQTAPSYKTCNEAFNSAAKFHNDMLRQKLLTLNNNTTDSLYLYLDFYNAFNSTINLYEQNPENVKYTNPLKPCFDILTDENGEKKKVVCKDPELSIFWDNVHPSQNGWHSVYLALQPILKKLLS